MAEVEYTYGVYGDELYVDEESAQGDAAHYAAQDPALTSNAFGRAVNIAGALASLALVIGVGVWGYKLMVRDVSGVPVVRALEGPMRVLPEDPGGQPADHQGLAVNAVAADGTAEAPAERLALAPRPVELTEEDAPMGELGDVTPVSVDAATLQAYQDGQVAALVEELTKGAEPLNGAVEDTQAEGERIVQPAPLSGDRPVAETAAADPAEIAEARAEPAVLNAPGVRRSLRPHLRPVRLASASATDADVAAALRAAQDAMASIDVDPADVATGTRLAQLGAYDTPEIAREAWGRLESRFGDYLDGKQRVVQKASSGGRTFYRLRAMGFADLSDARRFCSALVAENADCIPVTAR